MSDPQDPRKSDEPVPPGAEDQTVEQPVAGAADETKQIQPEDAPPKADETTTESAAESPAGPPAGTPQWAPPPTVKKKGGFRRFAGHRATQLIAASAAGFIVGGAIVGTAVGFAVHDGDRRDRPGIARDWRDGPGAYRDFRDGPGRDWRDGDGDAPWRGYGSGI
jgi:hypothetical protein